MDDKYRSHHVDIILDNLQNVMSDDEIQDIRDQLDHAIIYAGEQPVNELDVGKDGTLSVVGVELSKKYGNPKGEIIDERRVSMKRGNEIRFTWKSND